MGLGHARCVSVYDNWPQCRKWNDGFSNSASRGRGCRGMMMHYDIMHLMINCRLYKLAHTVKYITHC